MIVLIINNNKKFCFINKAEEFKLLNSSCNDKTKKNIKTSCQKGIELNIEKLHLKKFNNIQTQQKKLNNKEFFNSNFENYNDITKAIDLEKQLGDLFFKQVMANDNDNKLNESLMSVLEELRNI